MRPQILQAGSSVSSVHNLSPGLLSCFCRRRQGEGTEPILGIAPPLAKICECRGGTHILHKPAPKPSHTGALGAYDSVGTRGEVARGQKGLP